MQKGTILKLLIGSNASWSCGDDVDNMIADGLPRSALLNDNLNVSIAPDHINSNIIDIIARESRQEQFKRKKTMIIKQRCRYGDKDGTEGWRFPKSLPHM